MRGHESLFLPLRQRFARFTREELYEVYDEGLLLGIVRTVRWAWPLWWLWHWFCPRWIRHDCDKQPITCRAEVLFRVPSWVWLDV